MATKRALFTAASFAALLAASQAFPVPARLPASRRGATVIAPQRAGRRCVDVRMVEGVGLLERLRLMRNKGSKSMSRKRLQNRVPQRGQKRTAVLNFLRRVFPVLAPKLEATMPDPSFTRCSTCFFPTEFHKVPVVGIREYNSDTKILTFALPDGVSLDLPPASCLQVQGYDKDGSEAVRVYTPISSPADKGSFTVMVKVYENGVVSQWMGGLKVGSMVGFRQRPEDLRLRVPLDEAKRVNLICSSTGIAGMWQIMQALADVDDVELVLLCGNRKPQDMLLRKEVEDLAQRAKPWDSLDFFTRKAGHVKAQSRFKVVHVLGDQAVTPASRFSDWDGEVGFVDEERIERYCFPPAPDVLTFVCGAPGMYQAICGARSDPKDRKSVV